MDFIYKFSDWLDLSLNVMELVALLVSVVTFFIIMLNKFSKALKQILGPCGIDFFSRTSVLLICRKSERKKRAFIEFSMLKTKGATVLRSEWKKIITEFKSFYNDQGDLVYSISNCTALISESFSNVAKRYFDYFSDDKVTKTFGIADDTVQWVTKVYIEEAYITPTCLLTGLLSKYEDNWTEFIKIYVSTAFISDMDEDSGQSILSSELYYTFAWLLWGPSYELNYKSHWSGLCQISYGDESNSLPAMVNHDNDMVAKLLERISINESRRYGALISVTTSIYRNKPFYRNARGMITPENIYFYEKIEDGDLSFALQIDDYKIHEGYKAQKYYCTAYVWLLFELEDNGRLFRPEKCVAFFEHANLTDKHSYKFLIDSLMNKCINHFKTIFANSALSSRKYRYVCAMNSQIADRFLEKYEQIIKEDEFSDEFKHRIICSPKRRPHEAFAAFDAFFSKNDSIYYSEIDIDNKESLVDLAVFYTDIYMECFPNDDERESLNNLLYYLRNANSNKDNRYHIVVAKNQGGKIIGGTIFDYFGRLNAGVIEFMAVKQKNQSSGLGTMIYNHIQMVLSSDAYSYCHQKLDYIFCEIDSPEYSKDSIKKYLYFWNKHSFKRINFSYVQPALSSQQKPVEGLWLVVSCLNGNVDEIESRYVLNFVKEYMKYSMQIANPTENEVFALMKKESEHKKDFRLTNII